MIWFLIGTSGLFGAIGQFGEAAILMAAILPLVAMDMYLHRRTQASTRSLVSKLASRTRAFRGGTLVEISASDLVPGDLVELQAGEWFPADGLVLSGEGIQVDESSLSGEAFPVRKVSLTTPLAKGGETAVDTVHWGFAGTRLLTGAACVRLVYTGGETLYGEIVRSAVRGSHGRTPLQHAIGNLVSVLLVAAGVICLALAWVRLRQGHGVVDAVLSAVTLAVAAIPEEFPVVFTFFLGVGVYRMAKRHALVRRGVAVENIGRVSCICSDKTGTLTEGHLRLAHRLPFPLVDEAHLLRVGALASRVESSDPLDVALLEMAPVETTTGDRVALYPFTEERRREAAIFRISQGLLLVAVKGAPETILALCHLNEGEKSSWLDRVEQLSSSAHKVIACAWRDLDESAWAGGEPDRDYAFAGLLAFEDPVRDGVPEAVRKARAAGIHVIMVTGDHPATARAVAHELGIGGEQPMVVGGDELEKRLREKDLGFLRRLDVIARAIPSQKLSLVRSLQSAGEIVAVTGDGVNDVPALQAADIGIAMGERGTRSAREVGAIVLLDDNFRTIIHAIAEGRQLFRNLRLSFAYLLMIHVPLVASAALIPLGGYPLLYLPIHIVWLELVIHPTALLVFQETSRGDRLDTIARAPARFFSQWEWVVIGAVGVLVTVVLLFAYDRSLGPMRDVEHARATALVVLMTAGATVVAGLSGLRTRIARVIAGTTVVSAILLVQIPAIANLLHLSPLHIDDWMIASAGGFLAAVLSSMIRFRT
jgi:Ca2+-transporting ATPase